MYVSACALGGKWEASKLSPTSDRLSLSSSSSFPPFAPDAGGGAPVLLPIRVCRAVVRVTLKRGCRTTTLNETSTQEKRASSSFFELGRTHTHTYKEQLHDDVQGIEDLALFVTRYMTMLLTPFNTLYKGLVVVCVFLCSKFKA